MAFERAVFVNCPFDEEYEPLLQALIFVLVALGYEPKVASLNNDNSDGRLSKIISMIKNSKFGIHDISRCSFSLDDFRNEDGDIEDSEKYARLNMPFELGLDYGAKEFVGRRARLSEKKILVLEEKNRSYLASLSDIRAWDIKFHCGDYEKLISIVRTWLVSEAGATNTPVSKIVGQYAGFQEWHYEKSLAEGRTEDEIKQYQTFEMLRSMKEWHEADRPSSYS